MAASQFQAHPQPPALDEFHSHGILGILYAEDFDAPPAPPECGPEPEPVLPALTQADVDAACLRAVAEARASWSQDAAERHAVALQRLAASLEDAGRAAAAHAETVADGLVRAAMATVAGALPHFCRAHGAGEVSALLRQVLPALAPRSRVVVRVHAAGIPALQRDLDTMPDGVADAVELRPANLPPGDVRIAWEGGSLHRDSEAMCAAVTAGLAGLGLLVPAAQPGTPSSPVPAVAFAPERNPAHAE